MRFCDLVPITACDEALEFLWRYPYVMTDLDDPIELIRKLVRENESLRALLKSSGTKSNLRAKTRL